VCGRHSRCNGSSLDPKLCIDDYSVQDASAYLQKALSLAESDAEISDAHLQLAQVWHNFTLGCCCAASAKCIGDNAGSSSVAPRGRGRHRSQHGDEASAKGTFEFDVAGWRLTPPQTRP